MESPHVCPTPMNMFCFYILQTMEPFAPGDRVVAINTDVSAPVYSTIVKPVCILPDSPLRENTVYHVEGIKHTSDGNQGVFITGLRVFLGKEQFTWSSCRFRKVDSLSGHTANKSRRKKPVGKSTKIRKLVTA
jgi:hypothetical protein